MSAGIALLIFIVSFLALAMFFKMPVAYALGAASLFTFVACHLNTITVGQAAFNSLDSFAFLAIPFYIYAGTVMEHSGISKTLIDWIHGLIGRVRGALGVICTLACMAFGVLTGSAMATISAIGKIMAPEMEKHNYPRNYTSALLAATCFLGILIPPSVPGIMYALASGLKISDVWMVTVGPALLFGAGYIIVNYLRIGRHEDLSSQPKLKAGAYFSNLGKSTIRAIPALLMPIIIYGCIYGGVCTPTEAGALSAVYGILYWVLAKLIFRKKTTATFWKVAAISGASTATIGVLNAFSGVAGKALTLAGVSSFLSNAVTTHISTQFGFLIMINLLFLFMGTFMDINATILIMTPLLLPIAQTYGITAIHFGAIILVNMCVGFMTPPFAAGIFVSTKITGASFGGTVKEILPFIAVGLIVILVTTFCPAYLMFFVNLLG